MLNTIEKLLKENQKLKDLLEKQNLISKTREETLKESN